MHVAVTNHHPAAQTVPQPHPPTTDRILPSSWVRHRMGIPYTIFTRRLAGGTDILIGTEKMRPLYPMCCFHFK